MSEQFCWHPGNPLHDLKIEAMQAFYLMYLDIQNALAQHEGKRDLYEGLGVCYEIETEADEKAVDKTLEKIMETVNCTIMYLKRNSRAMARTGKKPGTDFGAPGVSTGFKSDLPK
jgi:hypothetical protein